MTGLATVQKLGIVGSSRIGVTGWSYRGYMTASLTGHYPSTWKVAVTGAALTELVMDYTVSDCQTGDLYFFCASLCKAQDHDIWREQSPIAAAHNVTAPALIKAEESDPNGNPSF